MLTKLNVQILPVAGVGLLFAAASAFAATYHVDQASTQATQNGSATYPYKTITQAANVMSPGDTCLIHAGIYRERVVVQDNNVTFRRFGNDAVVVSGADLVTGWTLYTNQIYQASLTWTGHEFTQVFYQGEHQQIARYPDNLTGNMLRIEEDSGYGPCQTYNDTGAVRQVTFPGMGSVPTNYWQGGIYRGVTGRIRSNTMGDIQSSSGTNLTCVPLSNAWQDDVTNTEWFMGGAAKGYILHLNALSREGEWWHQNGTLYFWQPGGGAPDNVSVEAQVREEAFSIVNRSGVVLDGIDIKAATLTLNNSTACRLENCSFEYVQPYMKPSGYGSDYNTVGGVYIKGDSNVVDSCYFNGSWGHLLYLAGGNGIQIRNSVFKNNGWYSIFSSCVHIAGAANTLLEYCTFGSTGRFQVRMDTNAKTTIRYCDFSDCMNMGQDAGAIESVGQNLNNSEFAYNTFHDSDTIRVLNTAAKQYVVAFYLEDSSNYTAHHNVVWNFNNDGLPNAYPDGAFCYLGPRDTTQSGIRYYNNTVWNCDYRIRIWNQVVGSISVEQWNNIYDSSMGDDFGSPSLLGGFSFSNNVSLAPGAAAANFEDAAAGNFKPVASSTAIDAGKIIGGITDGFAGVAPDAGAIEESQHMWRTGASITNNLRQQPFGGTPAAIPGAPILAANYDEGGAGLAYHDLTRGNSGSIYRADDVDLVASPGGVAIGATVGGEWLEYSVATVPGNYALQLKAATVSSNRTIRIQLDGQDIATLPIPNTGSLSSYLTVSTNVLVSNSAQRLRVCFDTGGVNLESIQFSSGQGPSQPAQTLSVNDFNPRLVGIFGTPSAGSIDFRTNGPNNSGLPGLVSASPWKTDFVWSGLDLDGVGGTNDVIYFTLVASGSTNGFASQTDIQANNVGWGVLDNLLDAGEALRFEIEAVAPGSNTAGFVSFNGFGEARFIKNTQTNLGAFATGTVNGVVTSFDPADALYAKKGGDFNPPADRVVLETVAQDGISLAGRDFDLGFSYYAEALPSGYVGWAASHGLSGSDALPDANPDGDDLSNFGEYANGGNPTNELDVGFALLIQPAAIGVEVVHIARIQPEGELQYQLEWTGNLATNFWNSGGFVVTGTNDLGNGLAWITNAVPVDAASKFIRVRTDRILP